MYFSCGESTPRTQGRAFHLFITAKTWSCARTHTLVKAVQLRLHVFVYETCMTLA